MNSISPLILCFILLVEFLLTHFTHVFGYLFLVLMLIARLYTVEREMRLAGFFDVFMFWFLISYAKTGPQYNGRCMMIDVYNTHAVVYALHYLVVLWIIISRLLFVHLPESRLKEPDRYLWLLLLLHPLIHSMITCIPAVYFPLLLLRILFFYLLAAHSDDAAVAPVVLVLYDTALVVLAAFFLTHYYLKRPSSFWTRAASVRAEAARWLWRARYILSRPRRDEGV